jgi:hypothetical protein
MSRLFSPSDLTARPTGERTRLLAPSIALTPAPMGVKISWRSPARAFLLLALWFMLLTIGTLGLAAIGEIVPSSMGTSVDEEPAVGVLVAPRPFE